MNPEASPDEISEALSGWAKVAAGRLPDRLALAMTHAVRSGLFPDGMRLPPERELAKVLAVSRPTVSAALELLRQQHLVSSRHGSGTWVRSPQGQTPGREPIVDIVRGEGGINLAASVPPDASHMTSLHLEAGDFLRVEPPNGYNAHGLEQLRQLAADHHAATGLHTTPDQILVTEGAHHGLAIAIAHLAAPGDAVAIEGHSHPGMPDIATATGTRLVAVDLHDDGLDLEQLQTIARSGRPAAVVVQPVVNNPTGTSWSESRLDEFAEFLDREMLTVVENNALSDLAFKGRTPGLASRCERATVIGIETLSKTAWGGLRIGWIRAPADVCSDVGLRARRTGLGVSIPSQLLGIRVLRDYHELVSTRRRRLQSRARRTMTLLSSQLPEWRPTVPQGGLSLWLRLPTDNSESFVGAAARHGVSVLPGALTTPAGAADPHIRLCFDRPERELVVGVDRLAAAWAEVEGTHASA